MGVKRAACCDWAIRSADRRRHQERSSPLDRLAYRFSGERGSLLFVRWLEHQDGARCQSDDTFSNRTEQQSSESTATV